MAKKQIAADDAAEQLSPQTTDIVERANTLPSTDVIDYTEFAGMGREEVRAEDYAIPFLRILQKGSPEVDESSGKFIPNAKPGDFLNTVTGAVYGGKAGLMVVPCLFHREYIEWVPRTKGGGFVASYQPGDPIIQTARAPEGERDLVLPNGNQLIDTYYEYVLVQAPDGDVFPAVIGFTSTQVKKVRKWNSMMGQKRMQLPDGRVLSDPPSFAFWYVISTVAEKNDQGSWHGWNVVPVEKPNDQVPAQIFREALQFYKQVKSGDVKRAAEEQGSTGREPGSDDDIPGFEGSAAQKVF